MVRKKKEERERERQRERAEKEEEHEKFVGTNERRKEGKKKNGTIYRRRICMFFCQPSLPRPFFLFTSLLHGLFYAEMRCLFVFPFFFFPFSFFSIFIFFHSSLSSVFLFAAILGHDCLFCIPCISARWHAFILHFFSFSSSRLLFIFSSSSLHLLFSSLVFSCHLLSSLVFSCLLPSCPILCSPLLFGWAFHGCNEVVFLTYIQIIRKTKSHLIVYVCGDVRQ